MALGVYCNAQERLIIITRLRSPDLSTTAISVADTVTGNIELMLRLTGGFAVRRADFLVPTLALEPSVLYYTEVDAWRAVYGEIRPGDDGALQFSISVWNPNSEDILIERTIDSVFESFDLADDVALEVASAITGETIVTGGISISGAASLGDFGVYVDGNLIKRKTSEFEVPVGRHEVIVAIPGALGDQPVEVFEVEVKAGEISNLVLSASGESLTEESETSRGENDESDARRDHVRVGRLEASSVPPGAQVFLDDRLLGSTPLSLVGVPVGRYELSLSSEFFHEAIQVVDISESATTSVSVDLDVNLEDPIVESALIPVWRPSVVALSWFAAQGLIGAAQLNLNAEMAGRFVSFESFYLDITMIEAFFLFSRLGHFSAGANDRARTISYLSASVYTLGRVINWVGASLANGPTTIGIVLMASSAAISILYDIGFSPLAASRTNDRIIDRIEHGEPAETRDPPTFRRWIINAGPSALITAGYALPLFDARGAIEFLAGAALTGVSPATVGPSATLRGVFYPFRGSIDGLVPNLFTAASVTSDLEDIGISTSFGFGYEIPTRWFDITASTGLSFAVGFRGKASVMTLGVRL